MFQIFRIWWFALTISSYKSKIFIFKHVLKMWFYFILFANFWICLVNLYYFIPRIPVKRSSVVFKLSNKYYAPLLCLVKKYTFHICMCVSFSNLSIKCYQIPKRKLIKRKYIFILVMGISQNMYVNYNEILILVQAIML